MHTFEGHAVKPTETVYSFFFFFLISAHGASVSCQALRTKWRARQIMLFLDLIVFIIQWEKKAVK